MRVVVALGDSALAQDGETLEVERQRRNVRAAVSSLAPLARDHQLIVTHGNAPHLGPLVLATAGHAPHPLDVLSAESEGIIGYLLEQELAAELPGQHVATLLTQVVVDPSDPAFRRPTTPIGPLYDEAGARRLAAARGWLFQPDGAAFRRVVASPEPRRILELDTIRLLVEAGVLVVCAGGGGIPVTVDAGGVIRGVEAVVDKDVSAALLAILLDADRLLLLTDVPAVWTDWQTPQARQLSIASPSALRAIDLTPGSMGTKAAAACQFVEATGRPASIGSLADAVGVLAGETGTTVTIAEPGLRWRSEQPDAALTPGRQAAGHPLSATTPETRFAEEARFQMMDQKDRFENTEFTVSIRVADKGVVTQAIANLSQGETTLTARGEARAHPARDMREVREHLAVCRALTELGRKLQATAADEYACAVKATSEATAASRSVSSRQNWSSLVVAATPCQPAASATASVRRSMPSLVNRRDK